jgi:hypothetical protein
MARNSVTLYQFADFNFDEFLKQFLFEISEHTTEDWSQPQTNPDDTLSPCGIIYHKAKRGVKKPDIIRCKIQYLQHLVIRRAHSKKDLGAFHLSSQILRAVIGDEYKTMLSVLIRMGHLVHGDGKNGNSVGEYYYYQVGMYSTIYSLPENIGFEKVTTSNARVLKYLQKECEQIQLYRQNVLQPLISNRFGPDFQKQYEISLSKIHIANKQGFQAFVEQRLEEKPEGRLYYEYIREGLEEKQKHIQKIDEAGRIYHILTNAKREVKQYLNIAISADCKNSHPMLFNFFIFRSHGINYEDAYQISLAMHSIENASQLRKSLSKLVASNLLDLFKFDELKYIYETSTGQFWDNIVRKFPEYDRAQVKEKMFAEVFYSKTHQVKGYQIFGRKFQKQFPNVMRLIKAWKKEENRAWIDAYMSKRNLSYSKPEAALSIAMMNLEARIFGEVLKRMYSKRWRAFHIHDCIIVPQTTSKNQPSRDEVISIMKDVYKECGLLPTFD